MNKLAERLVPVMNDTELDAVIDDLPAGCARRAFVAAAEIPLMGLPNRARVSPRTTW